MNDRGRSMRELRVLATMLGHAGPIDAMVERYAAVTADEGEIERGRGDRGLQLAALRRGGIPARMASVWAARFDRHGPLRRREALALALLECLPESMDSVDRCSDGGPGAAWPRFLWWGLCEVLLLLAALPVFGCARLFGDPS